MKRLVVSIWDIKCSLSKAFKHDRLKMDDMSKLIANTLATVTSVKIGQMKYAETK